LALFTFKINDGLQVNTCLEDVIPCQ